LRYYHLAFAGALMLTTVSAAARMPATLFLQKADSLRARGPFALFSSELKKLQFEAEAAGDELHDEHAKLMAAHQPTPWCAPVIKYLGARELIVGMHEIPRAELAHMDIKAAMQAVFERHYPCPR
jgi:hypothetical protein